MNLETEYTEAAPTAVKPTHQPPAPSYPEKPRETGPLNPTPDVPGTDAPEVSTGSGVNLDEPAQETDADEVGEIESQNP
ncbi:hypothetical protein [Dyadobacter sp. 676]|uniref:Uncharacterized protein n=1 Tax=Dyadobacter sp. 676 TaxID=3088362 RepID=A0AAU8FKR2_9BACT